MIYKRLLLKNKKPYKSFFLFGPRGVGKTFWIKKNFPNSVYIDLLESKNYLQLLANPEKLENFIPKNFKNWIIIDEVQKIPMILNEVHRLIENKKIKFILTGSSTRSLRKKSVNLLAGRALTYKMYPLTIKELGKDFSLKKSLNYGNLPSICREKDKTKYLFSYINTYLKEEVMQEALTRNLASFTRFLQVASFSQAAEINLSEIARETFVNRKVIESYFQILEDLLIAYRIYPFKKKAKRKVSSHPKFFYFDVGVFRTLRPKGILDLREEIEGPGLETLFLQEIMAINDYFELNYSINYWRSYDKKEVDFILYGEKGFFAFEIKRSKNFSRKDFINLEEFSKDYPEAKLFFLYGGTKERFYKNIFIIPYKKAIKNIKKVLEKGYF